MALDQETLTELLGEPIKQAPQEESWVYSFSTYQCVVSGFDISLRILPASGEFTFSVKQESREIISIKSSHLSNVDAEVCDGKGFIVFSEPPLHRTIIRVKPDFFLGQEFGDAF